MANEKTLFSGYLPYMYIEIAITVITRFSGVYGEGPFLTCRQAPRENGKKLGERETEEFGDCKEYRDGTGRDALLGLTGSLFVGQGV